MSRAPIEMPVETEDKERGTKRYAHPAFAQLSAHRITGSRILYGSDFEHHAFIRIRVCESELTRDLSHDWHHNGRDIIEFDVSEAQWATFVSSLNIGSGVPCTLYVREGVGLIPDLPAPVQRTEQAKAEVRERVDRINESLDAAESAVRASSISKKQGATIIAEITKAKMNLRANIPFVVESFDKHLETTVEKAKVEIHAYMAGTLMAAGLAHLSGPIALPTALPPPHQSSGDGE